MSELELAVDEKREVLARALGYMTASEVALLAGIKESTLCAWRKRKTGPPYVLFGNQALYSHETLKRFLCEKECFEDRQAIIDRI